MIELLLVAGILGIVVYAISKGVEMQPDTTYTDSVPDATGTTDPLSDSSVYDPIQQPEDNMLKDSDVLSKAAVLIKGFEGFSAIPYDDPPGSGKRSIGYGHQIKASENFTTITEEQAYAILLVDINSAWSCVKVGVNVPVNLNQAAALVSLCFNVGCFAFKSSTLLRTLNNYDYAGAADQFGKWIYAGGQIASDLIARRDVEETVFSEA